MSVFFNAAHSRFLCTLFLCAIFALSPCLYAQDAGTAGTSAIVLPAGTQSAIDLTGGSITAGTAGTASLDTAISVEEPPVKPAEPVPVLTDDELEELDRIQRIMELEIKTSTLIELAELCRELGLSEGGNRDEIANRIRSHFNMTRQDAEDTANQKIITIERAHSTEYFTIDAVDEEYARLAGGVQISLKDGESLHKIKAEEILFNRSRNIITATGGVEYVKEEGDTRETFRGNSITINLDTWSGSFIDTISERSISGNETAYRFAGEVISKTDAETTVLKHAHITNAKTAENYWSLDAARMWILPGSDWMLLSGVLKVGEVPVLWVPFFPFPADEMILHPVLGTRTREGNFLQTTTYIKGRPSGDTMAENSITKILGSGQGMERKREGLFLRTTGSKAQSTDSRKIAILFDAYSNLGFYLGTEISMPSWKNLSAWNLSAGLAYTRTVFKIGSAYSPFDLEHGKADEWNSAPFFGAEIPLRYRFKTNLMLSGKFGSINLDFPFYSDPFIDADTQTRSEVMDYMEMLRSGAARDTDIDTSTNNLGSYSWTLTARPNFSTSALAPYISSLSISSISSVFHFSTSAINNSSSISAYSPNRQFFYPDKWTLFSLSGGMSGTPWALTSGNSVAEKDKDVKDPLKGFGIPIPPWGDTDKTKTDTNTSESNAPYILKPPTLGQAFTIARNNGLKLAWNYSITPTTAAEMYYSTQSWKTQKDIDLSDIKSTLMSIQADGNTNITLSEPNNGLFSTAFGFTGAVRWQDHIMRNETEYSDPGDPTNAAKRKANIDAERRSDYSSTYWTTSWTQSTTINPLYFSPALKTTNIQYSVSGLIAKSVFNTSSFDQNPDAPTWDVIMGEFNKTDLGTHRISTNVGITIFDKLQNLALYSDLPPKDSNVSINATARAWITETSTNTIINKPFEGDPEYQPVNFSETINFGNNRVIRQSFIYDPKYSDLTNVATSLTYKNFSFAFSAIRTPGYELAYTTGNPPRVNGWVSRDTSKAMLRPYSMSAGYSLNYKKDNLWNKRLSFSINTGINLTLDLQRYTYTKLNFNISGTFSISKFMDFTIGTSSENAEMYRYLHDLPFFSEFSGKIPISDEKEENFFLDLINSFRFDNEDLRRKSGFKTKGLNLSLTHHLGDWQAKLTVSMSPWLNTNKTPNVYQYDSQVAFVVQWLPISELKTEFTYDGKNDIFAHK